MKKIKYNISDYNGYILWGATEDFSELEGKTFPLNKTKAVDINAMSDLSMTSKILLSAVAGAVIQQLLDNEFSAEDLFKYGKILL